VDHRESFGRAEVDQRATAKFAPARAADAEGQPTRSGLEYTNQFFALCQRRAVKDLVVAPIGVDRKELTVALAAAAAGNVTVKYMADQRQANALLRRLTISAASDCMQRGEVPRPVDLEDRATPRGQEATPPPC
jgi:hypothetical protein